MPSTMKGVVLTSTGEILATPYAPNSSTCSPEVGLNVGKIFDFEEGDSGEKESQECTRMSLLVRRPARARGRRGRKRTRTRRCIVRELNFLVCYYRGEHKKTASCSTSPDEDSSNPRYVLPIVRGAVNLRRYLHPSRICLAQHERQ